MSFLLRKHDGLSMDFLIEKEKRKKQKDRRKKESLSVDFPQGRSLSPVRLFLCSPFGDKIKKTPVPFPYRRFFVS
mgnify:CR=1 FL=1